MRISRWMNLDELQSMLGEEATTQDAVRLRAALCYSSYNTTEDVPQTEWDRLQKTPVYLGKIKF